MNHVRMCRKSLSIRLILPAVVAVLALWPTLTARADTVLDLTLYNVTMSAQDAGGTPTAFGGLNATGQLVLGDNNNTQLLAQHNGTYAITTTGSSPISFSDLTGSILLNNGQVTGGSLMMTLSNNDQLTADFVANLGNVQNGASGTYQVTTSLTNIQLSDSTPGYFAGLDISDLVGSLTGTTLAFNYTPGTGRSNLGLDNAGILSITIEDGPTAISVPLPAAFPAGLAVLAVLGGIALMRHRKKMSDV